MRYFASILFICLIVKTTLAMDASRLLTSECCKSEQVVLLDDNYGDEGTQDHEEKDCCDYDCHCVCCVHVLFETRQPVWQLDTTEDNFTVPSTYSNNYDRLLYKMFWHPPRQVQ